MKISTKTISVTALLIAIEVVLSRFLSINIAGIIKISLAFIPVAVAAMLLGPVSAAVVGALADLVGAILFPTGAYFPGFTLTALLMGLCYGLLLSRSQDLWRILLAVAIHQLILSMLLNTLWISMITASADAHYWDLVLARVPQTLLLTAAQIAILPGLAALVPRLKKEMQ